VDPCIRWGQDRANPFKVMRGDKSVMWPFCQITLNSHCGVKPTEFHLCLIICQLEICLNNGFVC